MTVICGFPAVGKTHAAREDPDGLVDLDSSSFSWEAPGVRHPSWPENYVERIVELDVEGWTVLCSSHAEVRAGLFDADHPFVLVYPERLLAGEYLERMRARASTGTLVEFVREGWDSLIDSCKEQPGCVHVSLAAGQYLTDVLPIIEG